MPRWPRSKLLQRPEEVAARAVCRSKMAPAGMLKARREAKPLAAAARVKEAHNHDSTSRSLRFAAPWGRALEASVRPCGRWA